MIYSVFDYQRNAYDYYEVGATSPPTAWFRRPIDNSDNKPNGLFCCTEVLAVRLPPSAALVGSGPDARGAVATTDPKVGSSDPAGESASTSSAFKLLMTGTIAFVAGLLIGRPKLLAG